MNNAANKVWTKIKGLNVTITGKIKLGFIEIAVAVPRNISRLWQEPVFCLAFYSSASSSNGKNKKNDGMKKLNLECTASIMLLTSNTYIPSACSTRTLVPVLEKIDLLKNPSSPAPSAASSAPMPRLKKVWLSC